VLNDEENSKKHIYLATHNLGKVTEIKSLLDLSWDVSSLSDLPQAITWLEDGVSFEENAVIKVNALREKIKNACILSDDSGLVVPSLGGEPGLNTSRYAGEGKDDKKNIAKLLAKLNGFSTSDRSAHFICVFAFINTIGSISIHKGRCNGKIALSPNGCGGFGYDSIFIPEGFSQTFAQLDLSTKSSISARGRAFKDWTNYITSCNN
jgi:XTP/dITP diphosphohydrolase